MRSSSPTTMPSTSASCTACSSVSISSGTGPSVPFGAPAVYVTATSFKQVDDAATGRASSPIGSCSGATPAPNFAFSSSSVRENDARSRSSLFTKIARGQAALFGQLPRDLGLHLDALDRRHDEQREVGGLDRGGDVADEVGVPGRVEHVDLVVLELERRERERHRDVAALLLGVEVADGRAVLDPAEADDRPGVEQQGLGQGGLAGAAVADEGDVADLRGRKRLHR